MILSAIAALLIPLAGGFMLACLLPSSLIGGTVGPALRCFAGGGLGLGVASCSYFVCLLAGLTPYRVAMDIAIFLLLGIPCLVHARRSTAVTPQPSCPDTGAPARLRILMSWIFSIGLVSSIVSFIFAFLKEPHGKWDAWLIWNMHARFLFRGGENWRDAFASGLDWSHWDYPLLLPLSIARGWQYAGGEGLFFPAAMAFLFTFLTLGLLWCALCALRGRVQACLAAMVLMGTPFFIVMGASQFADLPLAFFILTTLVMLHLQARSPTDRPGPLILAGLSAGIAAWTKNEGLLFLPLVAAILCFATARAEGWRSAASRMAPFLAGAMPVLLIVIYFKTQLAPSNDLVADFSMAAASEKLTDFGRYAEIAKAFFVTGISFTQGLIDIRAGMRPNPGAVNVLLLTLYLFLAGVRIDGRDRSPIFQSGTILGMMLIGYGFVYVLTPLDLGYHLATSLNRLFLQLWPSAVFLCFMIAGSPDAAPAGRAGDPSARPETETKRKNKSPRPKESR